MPKLPAVVASLDDVPEAMREFYQEGESGFVVDLDAVDSHPLSVGGKTALAAERKNVARERKARTELEREVEGYRKLGLSPEEIAEKIAEDGKGNDGTPQEFEVVLGKRIKEVEDKFAPILTERDELKASLRKLTLTDRVREAALAAEVIPDDVEDVLLLTSAHFDLTDDGKVQVLDDDGDFTGKTPKEWFSDVFKQRKPKYFKGTGAVGGGARPGSGGGGNQSVVKHKPEQAQDYGTYQAALKKVGGDHSRIKTSTAA